MKSIAYEPLAYYLLEAISFGMLCLRFAFKFKYALWQETTWQVWVELQLISGWEHAESAAVYFVGKYVKYRSKVDQLTRSPPPQVRLLAIASRFPQDFATGVGITRNPG